MNSVLLVVDYQRDFVDGALGFTRVAEEKNDIGGGFYMDDYVYRYALGEEEGA